jgi:hypothetical protein
MSGSANTKCSACFRFNRTKGQSDMRVQSVRKLKFTLLIVKSTGLMRCWTLSEMQLRRSAWPSEPSTRLVF